MPRHPSNCSSTILILLGLLAACVPKTLTPNVPGATAQPAVSTGYPTDARPASQRRGGGFHLSMVPLPQLSHGDYNLRPGALFLVDRTVRQAMADLDPSASDLAVEVWVLSHAARRDRSDAHWVSTATGGIAGTVGRFVYPEYFEAEATLRVQFKRGDRVLATRDVHAAAVQPLLVARTWGVWYLYRRSPAGEQMTQVIETLHADLRTQLTALGNEVVTAAPLTVGRPPDTPAQHTLRHPWETFDSISPPSSRSELLSKKYGESSFSVVSGHQIRRGEVIGRIGLPLDTLGYDIALHDNIQVLVDLTVLGLYNSATVGARWRPLKAGPVSVAAEARVGGYLAVEASPLRFVFAGSNVSMALVAAYRPKSTTYFVRGGPNTLSVRGPFDAFASLERGSVVGFSISPGVEGQLTPTIAVAGQLTFLAEYQDGEALTRGIGPFLPLPQISFGFR